MFLFSSFMLQCSPLILRDKSTSSMSHNSCANVKGQEPKSSDSKSIQVNSFSFLELDRFFQCPSERVERIERRKQCQLTRKRPSLSSVMVKKTMNQNTMSLIFSSVSPPPQHNSKNEPILFHIGLRCKHTQINILKFKNKLLV